MYLSNSFSIWAISGSTFIDLFLLTMDFTLTLPRPGFDGMLDIMY